MNLENRITKLYEYLEEINRYNHAIRLVGFDLNTICPSKAYKDESDTLNFLANKSFLLLKDPGFLTLVADLYADLESLGVEDKRLVEDLYLLNSRHSLITPEVNNEYNQICTNAYIAWKEAKSKKDFSLFAESFKDLLDITKRKLDLDPNKKATYYDTLIFYFERGFDIEAYDAFFNRLRDGILPLLKKIKESKVKIRTDFLHVPVALSKQEQFSKYLMKVIGYDLEAGYLSTTEHPFTSSIYRNDTRITTHYFLDDFLSNVFSIIHEGGHAIFAQNEPANIHDHYLNDSMSMAMHESVSRFYENRIGRSKEFIHFIYPELMRIFKDELGDVSEHELYLAINEVKPSLIRVDADELTYSLHIIIRYELEKEFINQKDVDVYKIRDSWNELYERYLGIRPENDSEGILQDVHWTDSFGYFPAYALGNAYNAMYFNRLILEVDVAQDVARGDLTKINAWMKENVFKKASLLHPRSWIVDIVGRDLTPDDFIDYLETKYKEIYQLD